MGRRCGCVGTECNCAIRAGRGVFLSGEGDQTSPLEVSQSASAYLQGGSTAETDVRVTGKGSVDDPYELGMDFVGVPDSKPLSLQLFMTAGTFLWTRPTNCTLIEVTTVGGGAGGDCGVTPPGGGGIAQQVGAGGLGGQGGGWTRRVLYLPPGLTEALVTVGTGGAGGSTSGASGGFGNDSAFIIDNVRWVSAKGGGPGAGTSTSGGGAHRGMTGPTSQSDVRLSVYTPAGGGGGKGANGNEDLVGSVNGGAHVGYDGADTGVTYDLAFAGDGGRGGRAFFNGALASSGLGLAGMWPGGGGGGGRGGANGYWDGSGSWTFAAGGGGAGAPGFVEVIAY